MKRFVAVLLLVGSLSAAAAADASTFRRAGLDELVAAHENVVVGQVVDAHSYWNAERTMILTDYRIASSESLKGNAGGDVTVTQMGGTVGDTSVLIIGGADLAIGEEYVLFVGREELPGVGRVASVREHAQGAFRVLESKDGPRAVSGAVGMPLVAGEGGAVEPPGGDFGVPLEELKAFIREMVDRPQRGDVQDQAGQNDGSRRPGVER